MYILTFTKHLLSVRHLAGLFMSMFSPGECRVPGVADAQGVSIPLFLQYQKRSWVRKGFLSHKSPAESGGGNYVYSALPGQSSSPGLSQ